MNRFIEKDLIHLAARFAVLLYLAAMAPWAPGSAAAGETLVLREQIIVRGDIVTLGDLFENAGDQQGIAVFRSPELGTSGVVAALRVAAAASKHGLDWNNPGGISEIVVKRSGRQVTLDELREVIGQHAADGERPWSVAFSRGTRPYYIDSRIEGPLTVKQLDVQGSRGTFRAVLTVESPSYPAPDKIVTGRTYPSVEAVVPARLIDRGATIREGDLKIISLPSTQVSASAIEDIETAVGMAARQRLIVGRPIRRGDLEHPKLVKRNSFVTITYTVPGMVLKAKGKALDDAAKGQSVRIVNLQSNRTIEAEVTGTGTVSVNSLQPAPPRQRRTTVSRNRRATGKSPHVVR